MIGRDGSEGSGSGIELQAVNAMADNAASLPMPMRRAMIASAIALSRRIPGQAAGWRACQSVACWNACAICSMRASSK